jgi:hypothetical protein
MKRALFALPLAASLAAVAVLASRDPADAPGLCALMTPAKMLENPGLGHQYAQALRSGDAAEIARVRSVLEEIRAVHGCGGEFALPMQAPEAAGGLPPGHPPIGGDEGRPGLLFEAPSTISI